MRHVTDNWNGTQVSEHCNNGPAVELSNFKIDIHQYSSIIFGKGAYQRPPAPCMNVPTSASTINLHLQYSTVLLTDVETQSLLLHMGLLSARIFDNGRLAPAQ